MRIPYRVPHLQHQGAQRHHPYHQRAPHASLVKAAFRKGLLWYLPCTSPHRSSSGSEESGLHHDIMEWAEQLAPVHPAYRHHQTGEDNGDAHLKNLRLASPGRPTQFRMAGSTLDHGNVFSTVNSMGNAPNASSSRSSESKEAMRLT